FIYCQGRLGPGKFNELLNFFIRPINLQRKEKYVVKLSSLLAVHLCRVECGNPLKNQFSLVY
ncbi:hypothetical protein, partial [Alistipes putredinis]|uniref:hypothetical protein n=1 Tax=Alistipes putredinis TaxID=28117 RepID=UPI0039671BD2